MWFRLLMWIRCVNALKDCCSALLYALTLMKSDAGTRAHSQSSREMEYAAVTDFARKCFGSAMRPRVAFSDREYFCGDGYKSTTACSYVISVQ
jgi:hypothetical protein